MPPESAESHHEGGHRVDLHVGVLPMNVNEEILYSVPSEISPTARAIQIEASIPLHDEACTREYELYPDSDVADKISFYLFTKPFPANPQISFSMTSFWIAPARDRRFLLRLSGKNERHISELRKGEVKIIGYR